MAVLFKELLSKHEFHKNRLLWPLYLRVQRICACTFHVSLPIWVKLDTESINRNCNFRKNRCIESLSLLNPLNAELNPTCHLLALLGGHHIFHVSGLRVKSKYVILYISHIFFIRFG